MGKVTFVLAVLLWTAKPAEATVLYEFESGSVSFSFVLDQIRCCWGFHPPEIGSAGLLTLTTPPGCGLTSIDIYQRFPGLPPPNGGSRVEGFGMCGPPASIGLFGILAIFPEPWTQLGTYTALGGGATMTISEVPDSVSTALMFVLGIGALGLRRRLGKPLHET